MILSDFLLLLILLVSLAGYWGFTNLNRTMKDLFPDQWEELGDPYRFSMHSIFRELRWLKFILLRKYSMCGDPDISKYGNIVFASTFLNVVLILLWGLTDYTKGPLML